MSDQGTVEFANPSTGGVALRTADGSYVLAEQLDAKPLQLGQQLSGRMDNIGTELFADEKSGEIYGVFIQAYGLSFDAVRTEFAG